MFQQQPNIGLLDFLSLLTSNHQSSAVENINNTLVTSSSSGSSSNLSIAQPITNNHDCFDHQILSQPNSSSTSPHHQNNLYQQPIAETTSNGSATAGNSKDLNFKPYVKEIRFEEQSFSQISCKYCRRNHRKCTRNLPSCSNCSKRGIKCEYERKNGRIGPDSTSSTYVSIPNPSINDTSTALHVNKKNVIGFYSMQFYEIIPKTLFGHLVENLDEAGNDFKAVLFSLQAWRELRLGSREYSDICFQHAKLLLAPYMDCFSNNFAAMTLLNLSFVCQGRRKYREQSMYLDIVRYFVHDVIEQESRNNTVTPEMKNLIKWDTNLRSGLEFLLAAEKNGPISIVHYFPNLIKTCLGFDIRNMGFLEMSMDKSKINDVFNVLDAILRPFTQKMFCPVQDQPQHPAAQLTSTFIDILHNGLKLALLVTIDNSQIDEIWNLSTIVTKSAKSPLFPFLPLFVVPFVDLAISEHARLAPIYLRNSLDIEKAIILMEDMEVISSLNSKLDRLDDYYQNLQKKVQASMQHSTIK